MTRQFDEADWDVDVTAGDIGGGGELLVVTNSGQSDRGPVTGHPPILLYCFILSSVFARLLALP